MIELDPFDYKCRRNEGVKPPNQRPFGISPEYTSYLAHEIKKVHELGVQVAIVIGGGNFMRGAAVAEHGIERATADEVAGCGCEKQHRGTRQQQRPGELVQRLTHFICGHPRVGQAVSHRQPGATACRRKRDDHEQRVPRGEADANGLPVHVSSRRMYPYPRTV